MKISASRHTVDAQHPVEANLATVVHLRATAAELTSLHQTLRSDGGGSFEADRADAEATGVDVVALRGLTMTRVPDARLRVAVDWDQHLVRITGGDSQATSFATNLLDLAQETPVGTRHRFDYFANHFYLHPESVSLIVELIAQPATDPVNAG